MHLVRNSLCVKRDVCRFPRAIDQSLEGLRRIDDSVSTRCGVDRRWRWCNVLDERREFELDADLSERAVFADVRAAVQCPAISADRRESLLIPWTDGRAACSASASRGRFFVILSADVRIDSSDPNSVTRSRAVLSPIPGTPGRCPRSHLQARGNRQRAQATPSRSLAFSTPTHCS